MKRILTILSLALLTCACDPYKDNPVCNAIGEAAMKPYGEQPYKVKFESLEKIDSTLMRTELETRIRLFNVKIEKNRELYGKYTATNRPKNAQKKKDAIEKDLQILSRLSRLGDQIGDSLDSVAYYDYKFTAYAKVDGKTVEMVDCYATVTPNNEVITMSSDLKSLHKATGKVIPGYMEIMKNTSDEEVGEE